MIYKKKFKRIVDLLISLIILILSVPFFIIIALIIKVESPGPIIFKQKRVGKDLRLFFIYKFRSMYDKKWEIKPIHGRNDGATHFGLLIRRYKIDELPQLINVLIGDMSLVGPRPGIPEQVNSMSNEDKLRYTVKPGLTGLSQVSGNIYMPWDERFVYDNKYIMNISLRNDFFIIIRTIAVIIKGERYFLNKPLKLINYENS
ncbi:MAG: sugar transferase [Bacteroidia bacterium]|nr:sugar transferase [Ignavibacteriaceae bacterium]MCK6615933.1 sugar transferase [Ignavibacteriaceae bacterium]MCK6648618.1 sugar transferase [Bacteroidia bacterium]